MVFGVLKDIKEGENRVICTPIEVASIVAAGHTVLAQRDCGVGSGFLTKNMRPQAPRLLTLWKKCMPVATF